MVRAAFSQEDQKNGCEQKSSASAVEMSCCLHFHKEVSKCLKNLAEEHVGLTL